MTAGELANIHAACFDSHAAWDAKFISGFLEDPQVQIFEQQSGFLLVRKAADEAEILTLAVHPDSRRLGIATHLLARLESELTKSLIDHVFLEVSAANTDAISLYLKAGFQQVATRPKYYRFPNGKRGDAVVMKRAINLPTTKKHT